MIFINILVGHLFIPETSNMHLATNEASASSLYHLTPLGRSETDNQNNGGEGTEFYDKHVSMISDKSQAVWYC